MNLVLAKTDTLNDVFSVARDRLAGTAGVTDARRQAFEIFARAGLPNRRIEDWKYTDLRVLMREVLPLAAAPDAAALQRAGVALKIHAIAGARQLVLVDGVFAPDLSDLADLDDGLSIRTLRDALETDGAQLQPEDLSSETS
jgi:Fe-S cluster assembly protein SufD